MEKSRQFPESQFKPNLAARHCIETTGSTYIFTDGFRYPFSAYFEMDIDEQGTTHLIFGKGYSYDSPGSIWYVKGQ